MLGQGNLVEPTMTVRPRGLVIDDEPEPLLSSIENWMKEALAPSCVPEFTVAQDGDAIGNIDELSDSADFVLLDSWYKHNMGRFREGIEVGRYLVARSPDLPILFYSARPSEWLTGTTGRRRPDIEEFMAMPNVFEVDKGKIGEVEELRRVSSLMLQAAAERSRRRSQHSKALQRLMEATPVEDRRLNFRLENLDRRRKHQRLVSLDGKAGEIPVPTSTLVNSGVKRGWCDLELRVIEFSGGQVLSYFEEGAVEIAEDVKNFLLSQGKV